MTSKVLIPIDLAFPDTFKTLMNKALRLIDRDRGEIHVLYVDETLVHGAVSPLIGDKEVDDFEFQAAKGLKQLLEETQMQGLKVSHRIRQGAAHDQILAEATRVAADLIVMMAGVPGLSSYIIGSNAERVVRRAECSVFIVRD
jgi:nucleotide-binding universal stress UspA family protein